jgi:hypothetical protein
MMGTFIIIDHLERALAQAEYGRLEDGTLSGRIPECNGVVAFGKAL